MAILASIMIAASQEKGQTFWETIRDITPIYIPMSMEKQK